MPTIEINDNNVFEYVFGSDNPNWRPASEYNIMFLRQVQHHLNEMLHRRGHVFMNDVFDALGFERTSDGAIKGWLFRSPQSKGYIDFGMFDLVTFPLDDPLTVRLEVDGVIFDKI